MTFHVIEKGFNNVSIKYVGIAYKLLNSVYFK